MNTTPRILVASALLLAACLQAQPVTVKLATILPKGSDQYFILRKLMEDWSRISGGAVAMRFAAGGAKDGEATIVKKMASGNYQAAMLSAVGLTEIDRDVAALQFMPLAFRNWEEVDHVREKLRARLESRMAARGYVVLLWADAGWVNFFSREQALTPDDLKRLSMFNWAGDVAQIEIMKSLGYKPVVLETADIFTGFQTKMIDAAPMPPSFATAMQLPEVAPHVLDINWSPIVGAAIVRKDVWESIPAAVREKFRAVNEQAGRDIRAAGRTFHDKALEALRKEPRVHVHRLNEAQRLQWEELGEVIGPKVRGNIVPEGIYDEVQSALKHHRATLTAGN